MLYALENPRSLLVLLVSFVVGITLHGWVQSLVADRLGDRRPRQEDRLEPHPRRHVEPFGAVAAGLAGLGWTRAVELRDRRHRSAVLAVALSGPAVNLVLGVGLLLALRFTSLPAVVVSGGLAEGLQHGIPSEAGSFGSIALLLAGASQLYIGALSLVPLPPLDGGRLLFALAPRSSGWQRAEHHLVERNIGVAVLLALLLIPLGGNVPPLPALLDIVLSPLLTLLTGG